MRWLSKHYVQQAGPRLALLVALTAVLFVAAGVGMSYVGGFGDIQKQLSAFDWPWLLAAVGAVGVAYGGYYLAYRGIEQVEGGPSLDELSLQAVVTAGFGGFLAHGGAALDNFAMKAGGADDREANVRVTALGGFEHGVLAIIGTGAAIAVLVAGLAKPPADFTIPWAVIPIPATLLAFWLAERYRHRLRDREGWRGKVAVFLDAIHLVKQQFRHPHSNDYAALGMGLYWAADMFALWASLAAFGFHMNAGALIVAYATGMVLTRRTAPLGGAGLLIVALVPTVWYSGAPWAAAVLGACTYRFISLFGPMPFSFVALPRLRALGMKAEGTPGRGTSETGGEPALQH